MLAKKGGRKPEGKSQLEWEAVDARGEEDWRPTFRELVLHLVLKSLTLVLMVYIFTQSSFATNF